MVMAVKAASYRNQTVPTGKISRRRMLSGIFVTVERCDREAGNS